MILFSRIKVLSVICFLFVCLTAILANAQVKIEAGYGVTYFSNVTSDEGFAIPYGCGSNETYQMFGTGFYDSPQKISCTSCHNKATGPTNEIINDKVVSISDFAPSKFTMHTLAMGISRTPGKVISIGENTYGQLGNETTTTNYPGFTNPICRDYPHYCQPMATNAKGMAAGANTSFIITSDNKLMACGANESGQLGIGNVLPKYLASYVKVSTVTDLTNVKSVSAGVSHTLILDGNGRVFGCGSNGLGQLSFSNMNDKKILATDLQITGVKKVAAGAYHSIVLKTDGTVWGFGNSQYGQLAASGRYFYTPTQIASGVSDIAAGSDCNFIIKTDKSLWAIGRNDFGQLGDGNTNDQYSFVRVVPNPIIGNNIGVVSVTAGYNHTVIQTTDGKFWACGNNDYGQLGDGTTVSKSNWVQVILPVNNIFPDLSKTYLIENVNSSKYLQPVSNAQGANVVQMPWTGLSNQLWKFVPGNARFYIVNVSNGYYMDISGASTSPGANNIVYTGNGGRNQTWTLLNAGDGIYNIQNLNSGLNLDINGASLADGAVDIQWTPSTNNNQKWIITEGYVAYFTITSSAGANGSVSPSGSVQVRNGYPATFTITPNSGYTVNAVMVDNVNQGSITSYTFNSVTANHTITATFKTATTQYSIMATPDVNGTISPSGLVTVNSGTSRTFTITPNSGYSINVVTVDGVSQGAISSYTFSNVTANHTITATFRSSASFPDPTKWYKIATRANTNQCFDVTGGTYANGTAIELWSKNNANQEFKFQSAGNGYYTITCRGNTNYSIDMGGTFANGQTLKLWTTSTTNANQKFKLVPVTGGYYRLETSNSGFSIDNTGTTTNGVKPKLWTSNSSNINQQWVITAVP